MGIVVSQVSAVLRQWTGGYTWWCPGCKHAHSINVGGTEGPQWTFDGNLECPSFTPSVRHFVPAQAPDPEWWPQGKPEETVCHYFITAGQIVYCGDCQHELNGQTVPMVRLDTITDYGWGDPD